MFSVLTCSRRQIEDKYSQHAGEDAGHDDVDDVEQRFPLDDEIEGDVLIQVILDILSCGFVTDGPFSILCPRQRKNKNNQSSEWQYLPSLKGAVLK